MSNDGSQRRSKTKSNYLYSEMRFATEISRTTRAISNNRLYIEEMLTKEDLVKHSDIKILINQQILASVRLLLSPHLLEWSDSMDDTEALEHIAAIQTQNYFDLDDLEYLSSTYNDILDKENKDYLRLYVIPPDSWRDPPPKKKWFFRKDD